MGWDILLHALLSTQTPLLPHPWVARLYTALAWGLVLACLVVWLLRQRDVQDRRLRLGLPLLFLLWCLWPGEASPTFWLRLAFRAPSVMAGLLCAWILLAHYRPRSVRPVPLGELRSWAPIPVLLGWLLIFDVFAMGPESLYAWGFAPLTLGMLVLLGLLPWLLRGAWALSALVSVALAIHVLLRLPTGNVWDVLLDPWLWALLQADWLRRKLRRS
jgi:hypothetical protein